MVAVAFTLLVAAKVSKRSRIGDRAPFGISKSLSILFDSILAVTIGFTVQFWIVLSRDTSLYATWKDNRFSSARFANPGLCLSCQAIVRRYRLQILPSQSIRVDWRGTMARSPTPRQSRSARPIEPFL